MYLDRENCRKRRLAARAEVRMIVWGVLGRGVYQMSTCRWNGYLDKSGVGGSPGWRYRFGSY